MRTVQDRFLDVMNYHGRDGHLTVDETETVMARVGSGRLLALALVALADHLTTCPCSRQPDAAPAVTGAEHY